MQDWENIGQFQTLNYLLPNDLHEDDNNFSMFSHHISFLIDFNTPRKLIKSFSSPVVNLGRSYFMQKKDLKTIISR